MHLFHGLDLALRMHWEDPGSAARCRYPITALPSATYTPLQIPSNRQDVRNGRKGLRAFCRLVYRTHNANRIPYSQKRRPTPWSSWIFRVGASLHASMKGWLCCYFRLVFFHDFGVLTVDTSMHYAKRRNAHSPCCQTPDSVEPYSRDTAVARFPGKTSTRSKV